MPFLSGKKMFIWILVVGLITGSKSHVVAESSMATRTPLTLCQPGNAADSSGVALVVAWILDAGCNSPLSERVLDVSMAGHSVGRGVGQTDKSRHLVLIVSRPKISTSGDLGGSPRFCLNETDCGLDRLMTEPEVAPDGSHHQEATGVAKVSVCVGRGSSRVQRSVSSGVSGSRLADRRSRFAEKWNHGGSGMAPKGRSVTRGSGEEENDWDKTPMEWIKRGKPRTAVSSFRFGRNWKGKKSRIVRDLERVASSTVSRARDGNLNDVLVSPEVQSWKNEMKAHGIANGRGKSDRASGTIAGGSAEKSDVKENRWQDTRETGINAGTGDKWSDDSGMGWIKRNTEKKWDDSGMAWMKKEADKRWDDSGMAWMKKDGYKRWDDSGMAWMKKNGDKKWDDSGLAWMKKDADKKWDDSGMAWMKKDADKRWDDSGMAWMKKDAD